MKKFQFKLQPVLDVRQIEEDQKKRIVGELQAKINDLQQQALQLNETIKEHGLQLKQQHAAGQVDLSWVAHYRSYVMHARQLINQRIAEVGQVQKKLVVARGELAEAAKKRKMLEKLKEKRQERYDADVARHEAREMDEIGMNAYQRVRRRA